MKTTFLRFPDETTWLAACKDAGYWIDEESERPLLLSHAHSFDVIGPIITSGHWDPETGEELEAPTALEGWHVNAKLSALPEAWQIYEVHPSKPVRVFAGDL